MLYFIILLYYIIIEGFSTGKLQPKAAWAVT